MWRKRAKTVLAALAAVALGAAFGAACTTPAGPADGGSGNLTVLLTDAPFPYEHVSEANVTITRVDLVGNAGVQTIMEGESSFNLLDLQNGVTAVLAQTELEAGPYAQIRLIVSSASVVLVDGREFDLFVPSGAETGIKVLLPGFRVEEGTETTLTLDFSLEDSFIVQGSAETAADIQGFIFQPVVRPLGWTHGENADDGNEEEEEEDEGGEDA